MSETGLDLELLEDFPRGAFSHVLFDFDGTISLLREGWQGIMRPVMIEMIAGDGPVSAELARAVDEYIDASTGIQTIVQMEHLAEMVREYGLVPAEAIKTPQAYKAIYNERLMDPVQARIDALDRGELRLDDVSVPGARDFVADLASRGLTMYIFSGTDRDDVVREAEKLGVAQYFEAIWGAIGSVEEYSKEKVLRELMTAHSLAGEQVLIVGDGPVEIRNGRAAGCATLGICSDESAGRGWDPAKRARLTKAGAHALVADFGSGEALATWLFDKVRQ